MILEGEGMPEGDTGGESYGEATEGDTGGESYGEATEGEGSGESEVPEWQKMKHRLKIDGEETEVEWDELTRGYQRASTANKRFLETKKLREEIEADKRQIAQMFEMAKNDPDRLLQELGIEPLSYAEQRILKQIEQEKKPREQIEAEKWKTEAQKAREEAERYRAEQEQRQTAKETEKWVATFNQVIDTTLEQAGLSRSPVTTARVGKLIEVALANNIEPDPSEMAQLLIEEFGSEHKNLYGSLPAEKLAKMLGEDKLKELRQWDLGRLKSDKAAPGYRASTGRTEPTPHVKKDMSFSDYMDDVKRRHGMST